MENLTDHEGTGNGEIIEDIPLAKRITNQPDIVFDEWMEGEPVIPEQVFGEKASAKQHMARSVVKFYYG